MMRSELRQYSDVILAVFVVSVAAMLLVPLPTVLVDFLISINLAFSLLLLLVGLYLPNASALLSFPSLLLLSTLFRLSLNVASARLILSQGDAGRVIEAFGTFLVQGQIAVGVIIFTIITIVNFVVIARGAGRVSEVAARFTLDALPGKQSAIDADVRAGLYSAADAQIRRQELGRESQFFGAMDGGMKFVQGDAIAGFFIILTNIIGGIYIGVSQGMSFSQAVQSYTVLTVGDGLVTQIPALLISICAGIVVTRVSSKENSTLSSDVGAQLFRRPTTVILAGILLSVIATLPGLPFLPFVSVGALFVAGGYLLHRNSLVHHANTDARTGELPAPTTTLMALPQGVPQLDARNSTLVITLDAQVLYPLYESRSERFTVWWRELQSGIYQDLGLKIPEPRILSDDGFATAHYTVQVSDTVVDSGTVPLDSALVEVNPNQAEVFGLSITRHAEHPLDGSSVFWTADNEILREVSQAGEIRVLDCLEFIGLKVAAFYRAFPEEVLTLAEVHAELKELERKYPGLLDDAIDRRFLNVARLTEIMQELVRQRISVRDVRQIIESAALYCSTYAKSGLEPGDFDLKEIVSFMRSTRKRQLVSRLLSDRNTLRVLTLGRSTAEIVAETDSSEIVKPEHFSALRNTLQSTLESLREKGRFPVVLLCEADIRDKLFSVVKIFEANVPVLSTDEIDPLTQIERVGVWYVT